MNSKVFNILVIVCLVTAAQFCRASANNKTDSRGLHVYLPREVTIKGKPISLGAISIIRGKESVVSKASEVALGRFSVPGQEIIVDRQMVLSRLACNQIPASDVTLTGAEKVTVKQRQQIIKGKEFVELASSFLGKNPPAESVCQWDPLRIPKDLVIPGVSEDIKLFPQLAGSSARNQAKVQIAAFAGGQEIGVRKVTFGLKYNCRTPVTLVDIPAGGVISSENVKIEKTLSDYPEPVNWSVPYGLIARRRLPANTVIRLGMVGPVKPPVLLERNQTVVIRIEKPRLLVTAIGKAMQKGCAGEYIRVQNVDSQRIILVRVNEDGTVEPVF